MEAMLLHDHGLCVQNLCFDTIVRGLGLDKKTFENNIKTYVFIDLPLPHGPMLENKKITN